MAGRYYQDRRPEGSEPRRYGREETAIAFLQAEKLLMVLTANQKQKLLAALMAKLILDDGFELLSPLIAKVQRTTR